MVPEDLSFLGAFAKLRKATISFVKSVCPSTCSKSTDLNEILYLSIFRKSFAKIQMSLNFAKNNGYFTLRPVHIHDNTLLSFFLE